MKNISKSLFILFTMFSLYGCMSKDVIEERNNIDNLSNINSSNSTLDNDNYSLSISAEITSGYSYEYIGEPIKLDYSYSSDGSDTVGLYVLCNGKSVPFKTDLNDTYSYYNTVDIKRNTNNLFSLYFIPTGKCNDDISVEIVDITSPDLILNEIDTSDKENLNEALKPLINGQKYKINSLSGIKVKNKLDGLDDNTKMNCDYLYTKIPDDIIHKNTSINADGTITNKLNAFFADYYVNNSKQLYISENQGEIIDIEIKYNGTYGQKLYTSFYIDNKIFPVFNDCDYSECYIDDNHYTTITGKIDTSEISKGKHICYSICGNVDYSQYTSPVDRFILEVE